MAIGRPKAELEVTEEERDELNKLVRRRSTPQAMSLRARIVLRCASGKTNTQVAEDLGVSMPTVGKWR